MDAALLVMDVQPGIIDHLPEPQAYLERVKEVTAAAGKAGLPVIYVVVGFRAGFPEVSPNNRSFSALKDSARQTLVRPKPALEIKPDDILVYKRRVSAFSGSDLEIILRAKGINHIVLTGISTSGVVLSTLRQAADKDYHITILSDLCADSDQEVQRVLTEKVFPRQAEVITSADWLNKLPAGK